MNQWALDQWALDQWALDQWALVQRALDKWNLDEWALDQWALDQWDLEQWALDERPVYHQAQVIGLLNQGAVEILFYLGVFILMFRFIYLDILINFYQNC